MTVFLGKLLKMYIFNSKVAHFVYLDPYFSRILFTNRQYGTKHLFCCHGNQAKKNITQSLLKICYLLLL